MKNFKENEVKDLNSIIGGMSNSWKITFKVNPISKSFEADFEWNDTPKPATPAPAPAPADSTSKNQ